MTLGHLCGGCFREIGIYNPSCDYKWQIVYPLHNAELCPGCMVRPGWLHHGACPNAVCPVCRKLFDECPCDKDDIEMKFANVLAREQLAAEGLLTGYGLDELASDMAEVMRDFCIRRRRAKVEYEYCRNRIGLLKRRIKNLTQ